jgi:hypothetical protein
MSVQQRRLNAAISSDSKFNDHVSLASSGVDVPTSTLRRTSQLSPRDSRNVGLADLLISIGLLAPAIGVSSYFTCAMGGDCEWIDYVQSATREIRPAGLRYWASTEMAGFPGWVLRILYCAALTALFKRHRRAVVATWTVAVIIEQSVTFLPGTFLTPFIVLSLILSCAIWLFAMLTISSLVAKSGANAVGSLGAWILAVFALASMYLAAHGWDGLRYLLGWRIERLLIG